MQKTVLTWILSIGTLVGLSTAVWAEKRPSGAKLGEKIPNLAFQDEKGNPRRLYDFKDPKAVVVVFLSFECPVSNGYAPILVDLARDLEKQGVSFLGLTVNEDDTAAQVAKQARDFRLNFPVFRDEQMNAAVALEADITPEAFVLDSNYVLRYRGRIDNSYSERLKKTNQATKHDLKQALLDLLAGKAVSEPATLPIGCFIGREERSTVKTGNVTYHKDVLPILQNHCQSCHRPGEVGPFALMTYRQAVNWADDIKSYTQKRLMPPWKPSAGIGFHNDRRIPDKDIQILAAWVDGGTPEGDIKDTPPAKKFVEGWQFGQPDLVLTPSGEFTLGPDGRDLFHCFVMPSNLEKDEYVTAVEIRPGNARIVHHVLLFTDLTGKGRELEKNAQNEKPEVVDVKHPDKSAFDKGPGYSVSMGVGFLPQGGLTGWAPGIQARYFPENSGILLPRGADVVMQVHYHRDGRMEKDRTQVGLYFAKKPIEKPFGGGIIAGRSGPGPFGLFFSIPPGEEKFSLKGDSYATKDFTLYTVMPHMHMLGKAIKVTVFPPDGPEQTLIEIPQWDYNWQETYFLKEPFRVKAGTRFHVEATYDNSSKNSMNPFNPPRRITFGEQTFNEMCFVFLGGSSNQAVQVGRAGRILPMSPNPPAKKTDTPAGGG